MSKSTHQIYIVDYWVPFPQSEYGGQIVVIAKSEEEVIELLKNNNECTFDHPEYNDNIERVVKGCKNFPLFGEYESNVVEVFIT